MLIELGLCLMFLNIIRVRLGITRYARFYRVDRKRKDLS